MNVTTVRNIPLRGEPFVTIIKSLTTLDLYFQPLRVECAQIATKETKYKTRVRHPKGGV